MKNLTLIYEANGLTGLREHIIANKMQGETIEIDGEEFDASDIVQDEYTLSPLARVLACKTDRNDHTRAALIFALEVGTPEQVVELAKIYQRHCQRGYMASEDSALRCKLMEEAYANGILEQPRLTANLWEQL